MPLAAAAIIAAHVFDLATFFAMVVARGIDAELNPFVQQLTTTLGVPGALLGKGALIVYLVALVAVIGTRRPRLAAAIAIFATYAGLLAGLSNVATFGL